MSDPQRLGRELLQHLELFRDLSIRWIAAGALDKQKHGVMASMEAKRMEAPKMQVKGPVGKAGSSPRFMGPAPSMFDALPTEWEDLETIRKDLGDCQRCKLASGRKNIVFGSGNPKADLMLVGEAPGADEDEQGLPFVGRAGQLLTRILEAIGMRREDVYICNILKCRPPNNRAPESDEIAACEKFLFRQVASIKPKAICALGTFGAQTLLRIKEPITRLRGQWFNYRGTKLMATFHPAYLLRNPSEKRKVWEDVQKIRDYLRSPEGS
jgi:uracil-DNA glycosylase family 4